MITTINDPSELLKNVYSFINSGNNSYIVMLGRKFIQDLHLTRRITMSGDSDNHKVRKECRLRILITVSPIRPVDYLLCS